MLISRASVWIDHLVAFFLEDVFDPGVVHSRHVLVVLFVTVDLDLDSEVLRQHNITVHLRLDDILELLHREKRAPEEERCEQVEQHDDYANRVFGHFGAILE